MCQKISSKCLALPLLATIKLYQLLISSWTGPSCRYLPTCSAYAVQSIQLHGSLKGTWLSLKRLLRCHPWASGGYDPVPPPSKNHHGRNE